MNRSEPESYQGFETLPARVFGVVRSPRALFASVIERPRWLAMMLLTFVVMAGCGAAFMQTAVGRQALVDQWERRALAFGRDVSDEQYERFVALSDRGPAYALVTGLTAGPVLAFAAAAMIYGVFGRTRAPRSGAGGMDRRAKPATYVQVLAVVVHAGVILMVGQVVASPLNYVRETLASPATLAQIFPMFDEASPAARFLGVIDLFVVWWLVALGIGVALLYRRSTRATVAAFIGAYVAFAAVLAIAMVVTGGTL